jgi:hypothetical protein
MRIYYKKNKIQSKKTNRQLYQKNFISLRIVNRMFESFHVEFNGAYCKGFTFFWVEVGLGETYEPVD